MKNAIMIVVSLFIGAMVGPAISQVAELAYDSNVVQKFPTKKFYQKWDSGADIDLDIGEKFDGKVPTGSEASMTCYLDMYKK
jgi:hypothetical protein